MLELISEIENLKAERQKAAQEWLYADNARMMLIEERDELTAANRQAEESIAILCERGARAEGEAYAANQRAEAAEAALKEWQDYWGSDSPHDTHVQIGTSEKYERQLGKEQVRANTAENRLARAEAALAEAKLVIDAARGIRHWHDTANGGMIVSGEHVMALWDAVEKYDDEIPATKADCPPSGILQEWQPANGA